MNFYFINYIFILLRVHPFCLCSAMIVWLVTQEQMIFQMMLLMLRDREKANMRLLAKDSDYVFFKFSRFIGTCSIFMIWLI